VKIASRALEGQLRKGVASLYAVHGAEALLALEAADRIREAARRDGCSEREIFFAEPGADWGRFGAAAANLSLFSTKRLMELRVPTGKPGTEGARAIEAYCARLPEDTVTLVSLPELDWQQQKSKWYEALERSGVMVEARAVTRDELPEWLAERLGRQRQRASVETLEWLADRVEGNLLAAKQEVEKLALLLPEGEITLEARHAARRDPWRRLGSRGAHRRFARSRGRAPAAAALDAHRGIAPDDGACRQPAPAPLPAARSHGAAAEVCAAPRCGRVRPRTLASPPDRPHD
jgi:DNA polymerase-3 subunit delta